MYPSVLHPIEWSCFTSDSSQLSHVLQPELPQEIVVTDAPFIVFGLQAPYAYAVALDSLRFRRMQIFDPHRLQSEAVNADSACPELQEFRPRIHITGSDFASITHDGALCDANNQLGPEEFADVIRRQARRTVIIQYSL